MCFKWYLNNDLPMQYFVCLITAILLSTASAMDRLGASYFEDIKRIMVTCKTTGVYSINKTDNTDTNIFVHVILL